jgi:diadenosine tetraphosphate (Ap4A) HIT family hydrolase
VPPGKPQCLTCDLVSGEFVPSVGGGQPIHRDELVICNHYVGSDIPGDTPDSRAGWLIVSPVRHVTRVHQLTGEEWKRLGAVIRTVDAALTELYGAGRCLVSSLGWYRLDHVHFHIVPTSLAQANPETGRFNLSTHPPVTDGWLNFGGDGHYKPVHESADLVTRRVRSFVTPRILGRSPFQRKERPAA